MAKKVTLRDGHTGEVEYPLTISEQVVDKSGKTIDKLIEDRFKQQTELINNKQMELGAMQFDMEPKENSGNGITSGGVYSYLKNIILGIAYQPDTSLMPNIDFTNKTITFNSLVIKTKTNVIVLTAENVSLLDTSVNSSIVCLYYNISSSNFHTQHYNFVPQTDDVLILVVRYVNNNQNTIRKVWAPFEFNINGNPEYIKRTESVTGFIANNSIELSKLSYTTISNVINVILQTNTSDGKIIVDKKNHLINFGTDVRLYADRMYSLGTLVAAGGQDISAISIEHTESANSWSTKLVVTVSADNKSSTIKLYASNEPLVEKQFVIGVINFTNATSPTIKGMDFIVPYKLIDDVDVTTTELSNKVDSLYNDVTELKNSNKESVPAYVVQERERVYKLLLEKLNTENNIFVFNTDQHFSVAEGVAENNVNNPKYVLQGLNSIKELSKKISFDCVVLGGDSAGYGGGVNSTVSGILDGINLMKNELSGTDSPVVIIPGNHDAYQNTSDVTAFGMYNTCVKQLTNTKTYNHDGIDNCDGYIDLESSKLRYIFVDNYTRNERTESAKTFLKNVLESLPSGYMAVLISHNALTNAFNGLQDAEDYNSGTKKDAVYGGSYYQDVIYNYSDRIIACISGHSHLDSWNTDNGILFIQTTCACNHTKFKFSADNITPILGTLGTATDTAFDIFIINQKEKTIEAIRYGVGCNRKWQYAGDIKMLEGYPQIIER